jgi:protein-tyrosine phosphatase
MAMALFRARILVDPDLKDWRTGSAGVWAADGQPASQLAIETMARRGNDLKTHRSRCIHAKILENYDLVLVMEDSHKEALQVEFPEHADKIFLLTEMVGVSYDIDDPYGGSAQEYELAAREIDRLIEQGLPEIVRKVKSQTA